MIRPLLLLVAVLLAGCGQPKQHLNILIWPNGVDPKIVADFERQFDCKLVFDYFDNDSIVIPKLTAGGVSAYDLVCIGTHIVLAEKFLNYLLDPQVAAQTAISNGTPTPNKAARELLSPEIRNNPRIYPPPEVMRRLELTKNLGEMTKLHDEVWTQIKPK